MEGTQRLTTLVYGNKAKIKRPSLVLLRCKMTFKFFELGLIAVQTDFEIFELDLIAVQNDFPIFELGLIAVQNDFLNFRAWPYCRAPV